MERNYWPKVHSPFGRQPGPVGSFHLAIPENYIITVWTRVQELTKRGRLGYMSSKAPDAIREGRYAGRTFIAVHCEHARRDGVNGDLHNFNLDHFIHKYSTYRSEPKEDMLPRIVINEDFYDDAVSDEEETEEDQDFQEDSESDEDFEVDVNDDTEESTEEEEEEEEESMDESDSDEDDDESE